LRARRIASAHHQFDAPDASRSQFPQHPAHERIAHALAAIIRMDG
jgi:hypothetical protein